MIAIDDVINIVVAIVVIFGLVRWWSKPGSNATGTDQRPSLGFRPKNVTLSMIQTVQNAFPEEPRSNVHYDLLRTGNVQVTCNTLIEKGFLPPPPPAFYQLYPQPDQPAPTSRGGTPPATKSVSPSSADPSNLIQRFNLENEVTSSTAPLQADVNSKAAWLDTPEKREANLRERKTQMILAARQKMLEKQANNKGKRAETILPASA